MPKENSLDDYEIFYEDLETVSDRLVFDDFHPEEVEPAKGLDEADVYKLSQDMNEDMRFDEQLEPHKDEDLTA